jgi:stage II sporulation protein AA (anti-sigma F factor antagonist)
LPKLQISSRDAPAALKCRLEQASDGGVRLIATGELDLATAPALERALEEARGRSRQIVLDMRSVWFCDSTGVHLLVRATRQARDEGRRFVIVRGPGQVQRLFAITGVDRQLEIVEDAAIAAA